MCIEMLRLFNQQFDKSMPEYRLANICSGIDGGIPTTSLLSATATVVASRYNVQHWNVNEMMPKRILQMKINIGLLWKFACGHYTIKRLPSMCVYIFIFCTSQANKQSILAS